MAKRPCLDCGKVTTSSRCPTCQRAKDRERYVGGKATRYNSQWQRFSREARAAWVADHGWVCPGWQHPPHNSTDLVVDHDIGVLCRRCNSRKAATHDKQQPNQPFVV